ncbi:glycosyltransferase, partial [Vibrio vulnificus]|nr:glycosyltransferase [Vibrio vulnificus]
KELKTVAVIMSVYKNDKVEWVQNSINSILEQSYSDIKLFLAVDGIVPDEIVALLSDYEKNRNVRIFYFEECKGLATRLNFLIDTALSCKGVKYLARMDADDVSHIERIEKQVYYLESNSIDVLGSSVIEIDGFGNNIFLKKSEPNDVDLKKNIILRCPFNHPTVIFKREVFDSGLRYDNNLLNTQDYKLWVDMAVKGFKFGNCSEPLLYFRVSDTFHSRRNLKKAKNDFEQRIIAMKKLNIVNFKNVIHTLSLLILRLSPTFVSKLAYKYLR